LKRNPTLRLVRGLAYGLLSLAIMLGILSIPWRGGRPAEPPAVELVATGAGPLSAGAAQRALDLGADPIIAGFPRLRWRAQGVRDPITVRALVLAEPGCRVALVSAEILLVPGTLSRAVSERLAGLGLDAVVVGATHTHAGPGGWWDSLPGQVGAAGPYDRATFERLADAMAGAVRDAHAALGPAAVAVSRGRAEGLSRNRTGAAVDGRVLAVRLVRPDGLPVAEVVTFAAHPTLLGSRNRRISGDWAGRLLATSPRGTRLFFQGAIGDQSATPQPIAGVEPLEVFGAALGAVVDGLAPPPAEASPRLAVASASVRLPTLQPGALPPSLRPAAFTALGGSFPERATVTALRLGAALLVFTPAEPVEAVGRAWRAQAGPDAEVISLSGDYLGYVDTAARFEAGTGEARRAYYGPDLAARLEGAVEAAALATGRGAR
jgi:neutral/alkaline ceramidase-like enzyme